MQAVEPGGQIEGRTVRIAGRGSGLVLNQLRVLVHLPGDEQRAHHEGEREPLAQTPGAPTEPVRWPLSALRQTPIWQVTDESTSTIVLAVENGMLSSAG